MALLLISCPVVSLCLSLKTFSLSHHSGCSHCIQCAPVVSSVLTLYPVYLHCTQCAHIVSNVLMLYPVCSCCFQCAHIVSRVFTLYPVCSRCIQCAHIVFSVLSPFCPPGHSAFPLGTVPHLLCLSQQDLSIFLLVSGVGKSDVPFGCMSPTGWTTGTAHCVPWGNYELSGTHAKPCMNPRTVIFTIRGVK